MNGTLLFVATEGTHGRELWKSDGTAAGTVLVKDINPNQSNIAQSPAFLSNVNGVLYFGYLDEPAHVGQLWKSDGTTAGTVLVKSGFEQVPSGMIGVNGIVVFNGSDVANGGRELWKSDGTTPGTVLLKDLDPGPAHSEPGFFTNVNGTVFFRADSVLWKTNGTAAGTIQLNSSSTFLFPDPHELEPALFRRWARRRPGAVEERRHSAGPFSWGRNPDPPTGIGLLTDVNGTATPRFDAAHGWEL